jgi:hypothetical protein
MASSVTLLSSDTSPRSLGRTERLAIFVGFARFAGGAAEAVASGRARLSDLPMIDMSHDKRWVR